MLVIERCTETAEDGQRCVYAAEHNGICSIYMPSDDRGHIFETLWSGQQQLRGAVDLRRAVDVALANLSPGIIAHTVLSEAAACYDSPRGQ